MIPGEKVGTLEEVMPGHGTFEEDGIVYSMGLGKFKFDAEEMMASVKTMKSLAQVRVGDLVIAVVTDVRSSMVVARTVHIIGNDRQISGETMASLHVSKVSQNYVEDIRRMYRIGDYLRAKVIQAKPSIQISTANRDLGVLRALCMKCRNPLSRKGDSLTCPECERIETRKMAFDFGEVDLSKL